MPQVLKDFRESHRPDKKAKTELRIRGLTGHEAAEQVNLRAYSRAVVGLLRLQTAQALDMLTE